MDNGETDNMTLGGESEVPGSGEKAQDDLMSRFSTFFLLREAVLNRIRKLPKKKTFPSVAIEFAISDLRLEIRPIFSS